ncbi:hypothetical protein FEM03_14145 [Phragmitibacter flavus]|uniref:Uncharacterized protein n=1 Tax=Phragmitibacter flavus TaxID=2576071 RepID=A0A5R8KDE1_9BACT|nr:hypothetical protein [Phragmitibacter flavus]TLD70320.1 hypothetical protein FEM03_14145 [Phragmitibacter flavus]
MNRYSAYFLVFSAFLPLVSCHSLGEITSRLINEGPPKLESIQLDGDSIISVYTLKEKTYKKEFRTNNVLTKSVVYHDDGSTYVITEYKDGIRIEQRIFSRTGSLKSLSKFEPPKSRIISKVEYHEDGSVKKLNQF